MCRIANDGLIEVSDLDGHSTVCGGHRAEIANVAIAANPDRGTFRKRAALLLFQPLVKFCSASPHIGVGRLGHFKCLARLQRGQAVGRPYESLRCHHNPQAGWRTLMRCGSICYGLMKDL